MNISIDTTPAQDLVIQFKTDEYNAALPRDPQGNVIGQVLTPRQFVIQYFQGDFAAWKEEFRTWKLSAVAKAYREGTDAKRAQIESAAQ